MLNLNHWLALHTLVLALLAPESDLRAATFQKGGDPELGCVATIQEEIVYGDANRFREFFEQKILPSFFEVGTDGDSNLKVNSYFDPRIRVCLDSKGGNLHEALLITDHLNGSAWLNDPDASPDAAFFFRYFQLGTAVPSGAECISACAVLFMGGRVATGYSTPNLPDRVLHVNGKLAFHAPSIELSSERLTEGSVLRAYDGAIGTIAHLVTYQDRIDLEPSLLLKLLSTPPSEQYVVDSASDAAAWRIDVVGLPELQDVSVAGMVTACSYAAGGQPSNYSVTLEHTINGADIERRTYSTTQQDGEKPLLLGESLLSFLDDETAFDDEDGFTDAVTLTLTEIGWAADAGDGEIGTSDYTCNVRLRRSLNNAPSQRNPRFQVTVNGKIVQFSSINLLGNAVTFSMLNDEADLSELDLSNEAQRIDKYQEYRCFHDNDGFSDLGLCTESSYTIELFDGRTTSATIVRNNFFGELEVSYGSQGPRINGNPVAPDLVLFGRSTDTGTEMLCTDLSVAFGGIYGNLCWLPEERQN